MNGITTDTLTPILTEHWGEDRSWTLEHYLAHGGYEGLKKARTMKPEDVVSAVKVLLAS